MGNSLNNEAADWNEELMKETTSELRKQIDLVDRSMTGLAKSIDSMQVACKMLLLQQDKKESSQADTCLEDETKEESQNSSSLTQELLRSLNESVTDHKFIAMEGLCKMIHLIERTLHTTGVLTKDSEEVLSPLDTYLNAKLPYDKAEAVSYYDQKIESLSTKVRKLMVIKRSLHNRIDLMQEREGGLIKEKDILQKQVDRLETELKRHKTEEARTSISEADVIKDSSKEKYTGTKHYDDYDGVEKKLTRQTKDLADIATKLHVREKELEEVTTELNELKDEKLEVDRENETLKKELESLKCRTVEQGIKLKDEKMNVELKSGTLTEEQKKSICASANSVDVQIYRQISMSSVDRSFVELLESKAKTRFIEIDTIKCNTKYSVKKNKPVLILCDALPISTYDRTKSTTVEGIEATKNAALVVFHRSNSKLVSSKQANILKGYDPYSSLGVIVDVVCDYYISVHDCDDNDTAIDKILNFISDNLENKTTHKQQREYFLQR